MAAKARATNAIGLARPAALLEPDGAEGEAELEPDALVAVLLEVPVVAVRVTVAVVTVELLEPPVAVDGAVVTVAEPVEEAVAAEEEETPEPPVT